MLTADRLREVLAYDKDTGVFTWRVQLGAGGPRGKRAGYARPDGYRQIGIDGKLYWSHRLAWLYVLGAWPPADIDHANMVRGDDRFVNLRAATRSQNNANSPTRVRNASGFKGVSWCEKNHNWRAYISVNRRSMALGSFPSPEQAHAAYVAAASKHFGEFARAA